MKPVKTLLMDPRTYSETLGFGLIPRKGSEQCHDEIAAVIVREKLLLRITNQESFCLSIFGYSFGLIWTVWMARLYHHIHVET